MLEIINKLFGPSHKKSIECLYLSDNGFRFLRDNIEIAKVQWSDIKEIVAFKRDMVTTDLICIEVISNMGLVYEFNEDIAGFDDFIIEMQRSLPGFDTDWREKVIKPAFNTNRTVIFHL